MMKIGFSSRVCPQWDLPTMVAKASAMGFDGIELAIEAIRPSASAGKPDALEGALSDGNVKLVCLGTSATLDSCSGRVLAEQQAVVADHIELASELKCPYVRILAGRVQPWDHRRAALARVAKALISLVPVASRSNVTLLVENGGDFHGSRDVWYLCDAVDHPAVKCCWNQCSAMAIGEQPTKSIPRLANKIALVHLCDAECDQGLSPAEKPLGQGNVGIARQIELLRGLAYDGFLMYDCREARVGSARRGSTPDQILTEVANFLRNCVEAKQAVLTAYKSDKRPARFAPRPALRRPG